MLDKNNLLIELRDILQVSLLKDAEVLAGGDGMTNRIVSVSILDVPENIDCVRPGEFLLTTAYIFSNDLGSFERLISQLKERQVCGMGIKLQRHISEVPDSVLRIADEISFPIIRIPQAVPFGDLIREIFNQIVNKQTKLLGRIKDFNSNVRNLMLRRGGMKAIAEQIYRFVCAPVAVFDEFFRDVHFQCIDRNKEMIIEDDLKDVLANAFVRRYPQFSEIRIVQSIVTKHFIKRFVIPIYFDNVYYGSIFLWDTENSMRMQDLFVIESVTPLIALDILNRITLVERENVDQTTFLEQLLSEDEKEQSKAIESAEIFLFQPEMPSQCIVIMMEQEKQYQLTPDHAHMANNLNTILLHLTNRLKQEYDGYFLVARKSDRAVFLLQFDNNDTADRRYASTKSFVDTLIKCIDEKGELDHTYIGVGTCVDTYRSLSLSLLRAEQTVRILMGRKERVTPVLYYDELGLLRVLGHPFLRDEVLAYADEILLPLEAHDNRQQGDLIETIRAYLATGGNLKRVSEILFTHYNTIIYRINRIRDVYGIDLRDPEMAFRIQLAMKIRELIR
ncbi:MAG TPA: PucR family transcriptional regulator [Clostridiaceae bacterium]|nr:PucR family transcriptional regulator [Clostridiaceae bacterium]